MQSAETMTTTGGLVHLVVRDARSVEKIEAITNTIYSQRERLQELAEHDPDLVPEVAAIEAGLADAVDAATRAVVFLSARMDAR